MAQSEFYTLLTNYGQQELALALGNKITVKLTHIAVGDGKGASYYPTAAQITLKHEVWRGVVNELTIQDDDKGVLRVSADIPPEDGGFSMVEAGIFDDKGKLFAIARMATSYKPSLPQGAGEELTLEFHLKVDNAHTVELLIDPAIVRASKRYVDAGLATKADKNHTHPQWQSQWYHETYANVKDLNDAVENGHYSARVDYDNLPFGQNSYLHIVALSNGWLQQTVTSHRNPKLVMRRQCHDGTWTPWEKVGMDKAYVDAGLNRKADTTYVNAGLNRKADTTYVDAGLNRKADTTYVNAGLNAKANKNHSHPQWESQAYHEVYANVKDLNYAVKNGHYTAWATYQNMPFKQNSYLHITALTDTWLEQTLASNANPNLVMRRQCQGGTWTPWQMDTTPSGVIVMWSGKWQDIPLGWGLCDGKGGKPEMRYSFIHGAATNQEVGTNGGVRYATTTPSGAHAHTAGTTVTPTTLTVAQMPAHNHGISTFARVNGHEPNKVGDSAAGRTDTSHTWNAGGSQAHGHGASTTVIAIGNHTHTVTPNPRHVKVYFIIKL